MAIQDHYLPEDLNQLSDELMKLHQTSMKILGNATDADFNDTDDHVVDLTRSLKIIKALHDKKLKRDEHNHLNGVYAIRGGN